MVQTRLPLIWVSFLQSPGWGREVLELHDHGMVLGHPWPPRLLLCATSWRFASAESHRCAQQGACADLSSHSSLLLGPLWVRQRWGICPGVEWLGKDGNRMLSSSGSFWILGQRNGGPGILRWQTQSISLAVSLCLQLTLGSCAFPGRKAGNQAVGMLLSLHVTVCTLLMPNLSGLWIY